jgi:hypothetical protein
MQEVLRELEMPALLGRPSPRRISENKTIRIVLHQPCITLTAPKTYNKIIGKMEVCSSTPKSMAIDTASNNRDNV